MRPRIPIVTYHTVGVPRTDWIWGDLTCPYGLFARQLERLSARGYSAATLDDVHESQAAGTLPRGRRVVLTFDDGYLDNWVYVYPLMKRAGWRGLVYVSPDFVDPGDRPRFNLEDVWAGRCTESDLQTQGFLNWAELEAMDRSGILQVGSHSMTHTWYTTGPVIVDFHRPGLSTPWLAWNARPDRKPFYLSEDQSGVVPPGTPIHENGRSLGIRRYFPDASQTEAVVAHVAERGGAAFFETEGWREQLLDVARGANRGEGRPETDEEMIGRYREEIEEAKRILETRLGHPVNHFSWPGGAYNDASWEIAERAGFRTLTVQQSDASRRLDPAPNLVRRMSSYHRYTMFGLTRTTADAELLVLACEKMLGRRGAGMALRVRKLLNVAGLI
jgi:peptidoglycan/xylan/chitin deacetylase (PgdA/CDA1 family)